MLLKSGPQRIRDLSLLTRGGKLAPGTRGSTGETLKPLRLVLLRHGESEWNASKRFSGWVDIDLTDKGRLEAARAGKLLKLHGYEFDEAHASVLKRAVRTLWTALHSSNQHWIPVKHTWRLNERHYGALTGLSKTDAAEQLGKEMLLKYRRGYAVEPLPMTEEHPMWTGADRRYRDLGPLLPRGESLRQCHDRILPYWYESVVPSIRAGRQVLVAAHNNVIRCLCKHLDGIADDDLRKLEIPTGLPLVYHLDPVTLSPVGPRDAIGFTGSFLTDPTGSHAAAEEEEGAAVGAAGAASRTAGVHGDEEEGVSRRRRAAVDALTEAGAAATRAEQVTAAESLSNFVASRASGRTAVGGGAAAAAAAAAAAGGEDAAPPTASVPTSLKQHAMLDEQLRRSHGHEYDLEGMVRAMCIGDIIKPHDLEAEARRLGLSSCPQRDAFARRQRAKKTSPSALAP